jgi:nitrogenase subunit NifH
MSSNSTNNALNGAKYSGKKIISLNDDVSEETIAGVIHKCVENEHINDYSKEIISNVLSSVNFHKDTYSPKKKVSPLVYHNPQIEKGSYYPLRKELQEKQKLPSKPISRDAIAFTQMFDGLMAHTPNFRVDPNGKIVIGKHRWNFLMEQIELHQMKID